MHVFVRSTLAGRAALADGWFQVFDQVYHLKARLWMPTDATVAKDWVASCDPSTAEALPCSASRAADMTSTIWSRSWPAAAESCSGTICEHPQVLETLTRTLLCRRDWMFVVCAGRLSCGRANWSTVCREQTPLCRLEVAADHIYCGGARLTGLPG